MADSKLPALTETSVPALDDPIYTVDVSDTTDDATGSSRKLSVSRLLGLLLHICEGRLTTESGAPVSTADRTAQSTLYFTPWGGNKIALYDGTRWGLFAFTEISLALSGLTSDKNYDVFVYNNAGTLTLELSAAWTNDTTPADALTTQDGVTVKSGATTRRWLGTIRTTGTTTIEDSEAKRFLWNAYNQVEKKFGKAEAAESHAYNTGTLRNFNNTTDTQSAFVCGEVITGVLWGFNCKLGSTATTATTNSVAGIMINGVDIDPPVLQVYSDGGGVYLAPVLAYTAASRIGYNTLIGREAGFGTNNNFENGVTFGLIRC